MCFELSCTVYLGKLLLLGIHSVQIQGLTPAESLTPIFDVPEVWSPTFSGCRLE